MMQVTTSRVRLFAVGALLALPLASCDNDAGQARNDAEERLEEAAVSIHSHSLRAAYPTPMTDDQADSLTATAGDVSTGNKPEWMTDEQAQRIGILGGDRFQPIDATQTDLTAIQSGLNSGNGSGGLEAQKAANAALRAETSLSLARLHLEQANRSDASVQSAISLAGVHIDAVLELQAIMAANAAYDPAAPLREIDAQSQEARARLAQHQASVREIEGKIGELQSRIDAEVRETNRLGEQAAVQREAALAAPLDTRISMIEAAAAVARQADAHQVAAAHLESQVDVLQPDLVRAQAFVLQADGELKDLDAARARIAARQKEVAAEGVQLQSDLRQAIEAFEAVYAPLAAQFENELMPHYDAARGAAESALRDARSAGPQGARPAKAQQAIGQVLWRQSMSIESFAQLVRRIAVNSQALGRDGQDAATADALDARAKEVRDAAGAALKEALDSIPEAGRSEQETAANQNLATLIRQSLEYITGEAVAEVRDLTDLAETVPTVVEPIDTGESPLGLLQRAKAIMEENRLEEFPSLFIARNPGQEAALSIMKRTAEATAKLNAACTTQFGVSLVEITQDPRFVSEMARLGDNRFAGAIGLGGGELAGMPDLSDVDLQSVTFEYDNARTTAWTDDIDQLEGQNFVQQDGQWFFEAPEIPEEAMTLVNMVLDPFVQTMESIANRTANNEFVDQWVMVSALMDELSKAFQDALMKMMPTGQDPGGVGRQRGGGG